MFQGEFEHVLDEKGRIVVPSKFRLFIPEKDRMGFYLTVLPVEEERCIRMYTPGEWERISAGLRKLAPTTASPEAFMRTIAAQSEFADLDSQFRILIPQRLMEYARLERRQQLMMVGCITHVQIWSSEMWRDVSHQGRRAAADQAQKLRELFGGYGPTP